MKFQHLVGVVVAAVLLSGCMTQEAVNEKFHQINMERADENKEILSRLGSKQYKGISKDAAMKAMAIAFQNLDIIVENSDYPTGLIAGKAKGVKPLSYEEYEVNKSIEKVRMEKYFGYSAFKDPSNIESVYSAVMLETADGVQISVRGRSDIKTAANEVSSSEFPPKWLEISYTKIWKEFEKNLLLQKK